jgi:hypothetical protein
MAMRPLCQLVVLLKLGESLENSNRAIDEFAADFLKGLPFLPNIECAPNLRAQ